MWLWGADVCKKQNYQPSVEQVLQATHVCAEVFIHIMWGPGGKRLAIPVPVE